MRAGLRLGLGLLAAALALAPTHALGQDSGQATTNTPATNSIGPRELQNFSIEGTVTRPAEQPPAAPAQRSTTRPPPATDRPAAAPTARTSDPAGQPRPAPQASADRQQATTRTQEPIRQTPPAASVTVALPKLQDDAPRTSAAIPAATPAIVPEPEPASSLLSDRRLALLPWLLAALALGVGGAFLLWRNRSREAFAGGPQLDAFAAPEPAPAPAPKPVPASPKRPPSSIPGLVSTRLRPWIEFGFHPLRCIVEDSQVTIEFELELYNSGSAPARALLVEATLFNAGAEQDHEIEAFFANPVGAGERIASIPPLKRMMLRNKVVLAREQVQVFHAAGRQVFVPVIAFNGLYRWAGGEGQSSISYLVGRDTKSDKMAPFRLDLGPRVFRGIGARPLPMGVRK